jgi:Uma2 family endonuclease
MSLAEAPALPETLTAEYLADLPDDGFERDLIDGELREWPVTFRSPEHGVTGSLITYHLMTWVGTQPQPRGQVVVGDSGFRLRRGPDTYVGIDVAYLAADVLVGRDRRRKFFEGPPLLAVEILSPSDQHGRVVEKVQKYLEVGSVVWVADPDFRTITVHRPDEAPVMFNDRQELDGDPYLPGFRVRVVQFFEA